MDACCTDKPINSNDIFFWFFKCVGEFFAYESTGRIEKSGLAQETPSKFMNVGTVFLHISNKIVL